MSATARSTGVKRAAGLNLWLLLLALAILVLAANAYQTAVYNEQERQAIARATELQVLSQQLAKAATEATTFLDVEGGESAFEPLRNLRANIQRIVDELRRGSPDGVMPGYERMPGVADALDRVVRRWSTMNQSAAAIESREGTLRELLDVNRDFKDAVIQFQGSLEQFARVLVQRGGAPDQVYYAALPLTLADGLRRNVTTILQGGERTSEAASNLGNDVKLIEQLLSDLLNGSQRVRRVTNDEALRLLGEVMNQFQEVDQLVGRILEAAAELSEVKRATDAISLDAEEFLNEARELAAAFGKLPELRPFPKLIWGLVALAVAIFAIVMVIFTIFRDQRRRFRAEQELNQRNQEAILRLLDEMGSLADGDLTVKATVTEDITGAIADSINFAVEALRSLVTTINETAVQVAAAAQETQATAMHLAEAAEHQAQQITSASAAINDIAAQIDEVSRNSAESADVAQRSVQIASKGAAIVRETIQGMDNIRDQIQETSKRIKRLGESSQEIGSIVELINDIAEQTNILALNAAIQAASAGEAGRGFAVVADEVQRLAERASNATKRIETLVQTIQSDTNEAVSSMEQTTAEVVAGARLAEDAGLALGEIEKVSNDLADLIQNISAAARQQSHAAASITATMNVIQEITAQTAMGASQTAESIGNLAQLAADLRRSVADFKLPS